MLLCFILLFYFIKFLAKGVIKKYRQHELLLKKVFRISSYYLL